MFNYFNIKEKIRNSKKGNKRKKKKNGCFMNGIYLQTGQSTTLYSFACTRIHENFSLMLQLVQVWVWVVLNEVGDVHSD